MDNNELVFNVRALMAVTSRMARLLAWVCVALLHSLLAAALLGTLWWLQVQPQQVATAAQALVPVAWRATADGIFGFLGLSGMALLVAYAKGWQLLLQRLVNSFVLDF